MRFDYHGRMKLVAINTPESKFSVTAQIRLVGRIVYWNMQCTGPKDLPWHTQAHLGEDYRKNWQLWESDVLETFLQLRAHDEDVAAPYLELQVSPLNQPLALVIRKPRESFYTPLKLSFHSHCQLSETVTQKQWGLEAQVSLPEELQGGSLWGGVFACLQAQEREYHALAPWAPAPANFHLPQYFQRLMP
jgi:hypothetical protein